MQLARFRFIVCGIVASKSWDRPALLASQFAQPFARNCCAKHGVTTWRTVGLLREMVSVKVHLPRFTLYLQRESGSIFIFQAGFQTRENTIARDLLADQAIDAVSILRHDRFEPVIACCRTAVSTG